MIFTSLHDITWFSHCIYTPHIPLKCSILKVWNTLWQQRRNLFFSQKALFFYSVYQPLHICTLHIFNDAHIFHDIHNLSTLRWKVHNVCCIIFTLFLLNLTCFIYIICIISILSLHDCQHNMQNRNETTILKTKQRD